MKGMRRPITTAILLVFGCLCVQSMAWSDEEDAFTERRQLPRDTAYSMQAAAVSEANAEALIQNKQDIDSLIVETAAALSMQQRVAMDLGQIDTALATIDTQMPEDLFYIDGKTSDVMMLRTVRAALSRSFGQSATAHENAIAKYSPVVASVIKVMRGDLLNEQPLLQNFQDREILQSARNKIATYTKISFVRDRMMLDQEQLMKLFLMSKNSFISNPMFTMDEAVLVGRLVYAFQERLAVI